MMMMMLHRRHSLDYFLVRHNRRSSPLISMGFARLHLLGAIVHPLRESAGGSVQRGGAAPLHTKVFLHLCRRYTREFLWPCCHLPRAGSGLLLLEEDLPSTCSRFWLLNCFYSVCLGPQHTFYSLVPLLIFFQMLANLPARGIYSLLV